jgi:hypothetical protein
VFCKDIKNALSYLFGYLFDFFVILGLVLRLEMIWKRLGRDLAEIWKRMGRDVGRDVGRDLEEIGKRCGKDLVKFSATYEFSRRWGREL